MTDINSKKLREYAIKSRNKYILSPIINPTYDEISFYTLGFQVLERLIQMQEITDYYRYTKCNDLIDGTNNIDFFPKTNNDDDILKLFQNNDLFNAMYDALIQYNDSPAYDKILLEKSLDSQDIEILKKLNPLFEDEHNKYNINVDLDFVTKQIRKWQNAFPDNLNESYEVTSSFLMALYKINKDECLKILNEILNSLNKNVYVHNSYPQDNTIMLNGMIIDKDILTQMLKDFDEQSKAKKYTYGDNNANK